MAHRRCSCSDFYDNVLRGASGRPIPAEALRTAQMLIHAMPQHLLDRLVGKLIEAALNSGIGKKIGDFKINPTLWMDRLQNQKLDKL